MASYKTFRLRGIPGGSDEERVKELVRNALECSDDVAIRVRSLADDPYPDDDEMMATLEFSKIPDMLKHNSREVSAVVDGCDLVFDSDFFDFTTLHTPAKECTIDIVAVSGLNGHPLGSFKQRNGSWIWLRDALVRDLSDSRVLTFGLDTQLINSESFQNIADLGGTLRTALRTIRTDPKRPLVLIGHSLGGIIVKEAVNLMARSHMQVDQASFRAIAGIMFFGVPNQGMAIKSLVPMVGDGPNRALVESLGPNSHVLRTQGQAFLEILNSGVAFHVVNFYETKMSRTAVLDETTQKWAMSGPFEILVESYSATHGRVHDAEKHHVHPVDRSHGNLVKFSGRKDGTYRVVIDHLKRMQEFKPEDMKSSEEKQWESDCLHSLAFDEQHVREAQLKPATGTCQWLLDHKDFRTWMHEPRGLLWVRGKPGSGKSTAMKVLSRYIQSTAGLDTCLISFFIHGRGVPLQKTPLGIYRSLLHQIALRFPDVLVHLTEVYKTRSKGFKKVNGELVWTPEDLPEHLATSLDIACQHHSVTIIVDALDEAGETAAFAVVKTFKKIMATVNPQGRIRICFSCRHYPQITLDGGSTIIMEEFNANDISNAINIGMSESHFTDTQKQLLQNVLLARSNGVFQWTSLVLDSTIQSQPRGYSFEETLKLVEVVPADLHDLYKSLLRPAETPQSSRSAHHLREQQRTLKLFQWVLFAIRPLSPEQLQHALALDWRMKQTSVTEYQNSQDFIHEEHLALRIKDLSKGLIHISEPFSSGQVQFIHQSVPDFLLSSLETLQKLCVDSAIPMTWLSHFQLSRSCLKFLLMSEVREAFDEKLRDDERILYRFDTFLDWKNRDHSQEEEVRRHYPKLPLVLYAWQNWVFHAENAQRQNFEVPLEFAGQDPLYSVSQTNKILQRPSNLRISNLLGDPTESCYHEFHADSCFQLMKSPFEYYYKHSFFSNANSAPSMVHLFAYCGLDGFTRYLGNLHPTSLEEEDGFYNTPLKFAIMGKQKSTIRLLLQSEVDVNPSPRVGVESPLCLACKWGDMEVISLLIRAKANINFSGLFHTPLYCAAFAGHENVVDFLLESGATVNQRSENGNTALFAVASSDESRLDIFASLLRHGVSIDLRNRERATTLHYSAARSPTPVFKAFLEEALKVEERNRSGKRDAWGIISKLSKQSQSYLSIINGQDYEGKTPILWALRHQDWKRLELLYDAGANINIRDGSGNTPLLEAADSSSDEHIAFFLRAGASVDEVGSNGNTALLAYLNRKVEMETLRLFIQYGANLNATDTQGRSPLMRAVRERRVGEAALFLQHGAEVNAQDHDGRTPLLHAIRSFNRGFCEFSSSVDECSKTVELLLNSGANVHAVDHSGKNALFYVRTEGAEPIFRLLQESGLQEVLGHSSESEPEKDDDVPPPSPKGKTQRMRKGARKFVASITRRLGA